MHYDRFAIKQFILSGTIEGDKLAPSEIISKDTVTLEETSLNIMIVEADMHLIPHMHWSLSSSPNVHVISNETDVLCLLLLYSFEFFICGLNELWICVVSRES